MSDYISGLLDSARSSLAIGMRLSRQGSYARRAPDSESLPHFEHARSILTAILSTAPDNREALLMQSSVSECLLQFDDAMNFLSRAFESGEPKTKKTLKRLALLRESAAEWRDVRLSPQSLRELGSYLSAHGVGPHSRDLRLTREWLAAQNAYEPNEVLAALGRRGAYSDFQVLANIVYG